MQGKKLVRTQSNVGIMLIEMDTKMYEEFSKKMFAALRKFGTSRKTRAVHKLIDKMMPAPAIFAGTASNVLVLASAKDTTLHHISLNMYHFDDTLGGKGSVGLATEMMDLEKKIKKEETFVNDARLKNIETLKKNKEETESKLLKSFDYIKMVDGTYLGWLLLMARITVTQDSAGKAKIVTTAADI